MDLFASQKTEFDFPNAKLVYFPNFYSIENSNRYFELLKRSTPWQQDNITLFGKTHKQPRLTALYANNDMPYKYSNITMHPHKFTEELLQIKNGSTQKVVG